MSIEKQPEAMEDAEELTSLEELESDEEGAGFWFVVALAIVAIAVIVVVGYLILWLIGMAQTPSPLLR